MKKLTLKNDVLEVELAVPFVPGSGGNRFCGGAWIRNIQRLNNGTRCFVGESIDPAVPTFGCPQEFRMPLPLGVPRENEMKQLKIGVGETVHRKGESRFLDQVLEAAPWSYSLENNTALFAQNVESLEGYAYALAQQVSIEDHLVVIKNQLKNTGRTRLETEVYLHPFFDERLPDSAYWFQVPSRKASMTQSCTGSPCLKSFPPNNTVISDKELCPACNWIATGNQKSGEFVGIYSETLFSKINMWRKPGLCYAIEPFIPIRLEPGESQEWTWSILVGSKRSRLKNRR